MRARGQYMYNEKGERYLDCINNVAHGTCTRHCTYFDLLCHVIAIFQVSNFSKEYKFLCKKTQRKNFKSGRRWGIKYFNSYTNTIFFSISKKSIVIFYQRWKYQTEFLGSVFLCLSRSLSPRSCPGWSEADGAIEH